MQQDWIHALFGGVLIGVSVSLMLLWNGRVTGISGIVGGMLKPIKGDFLWRFLFFAGLLVGGIIMKFIKPSVFENSILMPTGSLILAGLLVGFGTSLGSGCTSGHGVCGISRLSVRSMVATLIFMSAGILSVYLFRTLGLMK